jgi:hypothetical protein
MPWMTACDGDALRPEGYSRLLPPTALGVAAPEPGAPAGGRGLASAGLNCIRGPAGGPPSVDGGDTPGT